MPYMRFSLSNSSIKFYFRQSNHFLHKYFRAIKCMLENLDRSEMAVELGFSLPLCSYLIVFQVFAVLSLPSTKR